jgi:hypothetical protein
LVNVEILTNHEFPAQFFLSEYHYHLSNNGSSDLPKLKLRFRFSDQIFPKPDYVFHSHKGLARWSYRIEVSKERISIDANGNRAAIPMIHHMLVHPSLRYLAAFQGVLMLHASAVSFQGKSLLFTGRGGVGKTTTTSLILSEGNHCWEMHADDYVFIAPGPTSLAYLTRSHLYRDLLYWVPELKNKLTPTERLSLEFFGRIRVWSHDRIKWPVRLPLDRLWPDRTVSFQAFPASLVILDRADVREPTVGNIDNQSTVIQDLIQMNFYEARHYMNLIEKSKSVAKLQEWLDEWKEQEVKLLSQRLRKIPINFLYLPLYAKPSNMMKEKLVKQLKSLVT